MKDNVFRCIKCNKILSYEEIGHNFCVNCDPAIETELDKDILDNGDH